MNLLTWCGLQAQDFSSGIWSEELALWKFLLLAAFGWACGQLANCTRRQLLRRRQYAVSMDQLARASFRRQPRSD